MRIYFDTEFWEHDNGIDLISLGAVREDGQEFYCEFQSFDWDTAPPHHWIQKNVRPHLLGGDNVLTDQEFRNRFFAFVGKRPEFWTWYGDYDWVALCQKFGTMVDLPQGWPQHALDLRQEVQRFNEQNVATGMRMVPRKAEELGFTAHNALEDAKWTRMIGQDILQRTGWNGDS